MNLRAGSPAAAKILREECTISNLLTPLQSSFVTSLCRLLPSPVFGKLPFGHVVGLNLPRCMVRRRTAREKCLEEESLRQCIRPFCGELFLLAMMRYAACCPQKPLGHVRAHSVNRFQARRSDCSFIFTRPMQTLVGELGSIFCYVCLCRCSAGSRFVILTT